MKTLRVIDSHTGGEPTRIVIEGAPDLGDGSMAARRERLKIEHDWLRSAVVNEPRGADAMVGGVLLEPEDEACAAGVIFFNNRGYLNMCGHGAIGLVATLAHLGRFGAGAHRIETPVGEIGATLAASGDVTIANVPSYRWRKDVDVDVEVEGDSERGVIRGDIAWGGNWFFLVKDYAGEVAFGKLRELSAFAMAVKAALVAHGITGEGGAEIDHIEVFGACPDELADSRNFVLCPGDAYDRSPCGTGTSAKVACLFEDGVLSAGEVWRQASILGSVFEARVEPGVKGRVIPHLTGRAFVNGDCRVLLDPDDPFRDGITPETVR